MWPSELTPALILASLLPLALVLLQSGFRTHSLLSNRFFGPLFLWIGFGFSPTYAYAFGVHWQAYMLDPEYINTSLLFATLCSATYLVGYDIVFRRASRETTRWPSAQDMASRIVVPLCVLSFALFIYTVGGVDEVLHASYRRGMRPVSSGFMLNFLKAAKTVLFVSNIILAVMASRLLTMVGDNAQSRHLLGALGIAIAILEPCHKFGRVAGLPLCILAVALFAQGTRKTTAAAVALALAAVFLGQTGYHYRSEYRPGLANFADACMLHVESYVQELVGTAPRKTVVQSDHVLQPEEVNFLSKNAEFTRTVAYHTEHPLDTWAAGFGFVRNLNPLPRFVVPMAKTTTNLARIMNRSGTGITTPLAAELFSIWGFYGAAFYAFVGAVYGAIDRYGAKLGIEARFAVFFLTLVSWPLGLHLSLRGQFRPVGVAIAIIVGTRWWRNRSYGRFRSTDSSV